MCRPATHAILINCSVRVELTHRMVGVSTRGDPYLSAFFHGSSDKVERRESRLVGRGFGDPHLFQLAYTGP